MSIPVYPIPSTTSVTGTVLTEDDSNNVTNNEILIQLQLMNLHLSTLTGDELTEEDLEEQ